MASPLGSGRYTTCEHENCTEVIRSLTEKKFHARYHSPSVEFKCELCFFGFNSNKELVKHHKNLHAERVYRCLAKNCTNSYGSRNSLFNHVAVILKKVQDPAHADHLDNTANLIAYTSTDKISSATERVLHVCKEFEGCSRIFSRERDLKVHITKVHTQSQKTLVESLLRKRELEEPSHPPLKESAVQEIIISDENNSQVLNIPTTSDSDTDETLSDENPWLANYYKKSII